MAGFEAPSFSLGLDLDIDPPSFSLGLDLDLDPEPHLPPTNPPPDSSTNEGLEEELVVDSDPDQGPEPPRILRRLRRGIGAPRSSSSAAASVAERVFEDLRHKRPIDDDDIEDFSSQEGIIGAVPCTMVKLLPSDHEVKEVRPSTQYNSVCSTSKAPLHQHGILMTKFSNQSKAKEDKRASHVNDSASIGTKNDSFVFPKLTISPLRRFQLIDSDSDSDDSCVDIDTKGKAHTDDASLKARQSNSGNRATFLEQSKGYASVSVPRNKDLWEDLCPMSAKIATPVFDEVCEEYFNSAKNKKSQNLGGIPPTSLKNGLSSQIDGQHGVQNSSLPPAHHYFFNDDPRIQRLVRNRLPNFFPLGGTASEGNGQLGASVIDYMCQFSNGETSKRPATQNANLTGSSTTRRRKSKHSTAEETTQGWVDPKHTSVSPKDAGKRRVQADGQSTGHWYSGPNGKRVYVNKNGQELTGRIAYQQYKRESGTGFKKSKKKTNTKKATTSKKTATTKKRKR